MLFKGCCCEVPTLWRNFSEKLKIFDVTHHTQIIMCLNCSHQMTQDMKALLCTFSECLSFCLAFPIYILFYLFCIYNVYTLKGTALHFLVCNANKEILICNQHQVCFSCLSNSCILFVRFLLQFLSCASLTVTTEYQNKPPQSDLFRSI